MRFLLRPETIKNPSQSIINNEANELTLTIQQLIEYKNTRLKNINEIYKFVLKKSRYNQSTVRMGY
jgi:hypothetical protein